MIFSDMSEKIGQNKMFVPHKSETQKETLFALHFLLFCRIPSLLQSFNFCVDISCERRIIKPKSLKVGDFICARTFVCFT